jgi:hypothetical protein
MLQRIREQAGGAGLIVGVIALILAITGAAYAAGKGGLTAKQKKEVEKIAKKFAKQGPQGPQGAAGSNGTNGTNGKDGTNGNNGESVALAAASGCEGVKVSVGGTSKEVCDGEEGEPGEPGSSVELLGSFTGAQEVPPNEGPCNGAGGSEYEVEGSGTENIVCNGEKGEQGSPWAVAGVLPPSTNPNCPEIGFETEIHGCSETGAYAFSGTAADTEGVYAQISFPIQLSSPLESGEVHFVTKEDFVNETVPPECPGSQNFPRALPGNLCVYESAAGRTVNATFDGIFTPTNEANEEEGASRTGAVLRFTMSGVGFGSGSWAVTAP